MDDSQSGAQTVASTVIRSHIPRMRQINVGRKRPYVYDVMLAIDDDSWSVQKRYSEFFELHRQLKDVLPGYPPFPPKRVVKNKDPKFVESRRRDLESWLENILNHKNILQYEAVTSFLNVPDSILQAKRLAMTSGVQQNTIQWAAEGKARSVPNDGAIPDYDDSKDKLEASELPLMRELPDKHEVARAMACALAGSPSRSLDDFSLLIYGRDDLADADDEDGEKPRPRAATQSAALSAVALPTPPSTPSRQNPLVFRATSSYDGKDGDLSFEEGEMLVVVDVEPTSGWWLGTKDNQQFGLVPPNLVHWVPRQRSASAAAGLAHIAPDDSAIEKPARRDSISPDEMATTSSEYSVDRVSDEIVPEDIAAPSS